VPPRGRAFPARPRLSGDAASPARRAPVPGRTRPAGSSPRSPDPGSRTRTRTGDDDPGSGCSRPGSTPPTRARNRWRPRWGAARRSRTTGCPGRRADPGRPRRRSWAAAPGRTPCPSSGRRASPANPSRTSPRCSRCCRSTWRGWRAASVGPRSPAPRPRPRWRRVPPPGKRRTRTRSPATPGLPPRRRRRRSRRSRRFRPPTPAGGPHERRPPGRSARGTGLGRPGRGSSRPESSPRRGRTPRGR